MKLNTSKSILQEFTSAECQYNPANMYNVLKNFYSKKEPRIRRDVQVLCMQHSYYWGLSSICYDESCDRFKVQIWSSGFTIIFWYLTMLAISRITILMISSQIQRSISDNFSLERAGRMDIIYLYYTSCLFFPWLLHLHTGGMRHEMCAHLNSFHQHSKYLIGMIKSVIPERKVFQCLYMIFVTLIMKL